MLIAVSFETIEKESSWRSLLLVVVRNIETERVLSFRMDLTGYPHHLFIGITNHGRNKLSLRRLIKNCGTVLIIAIVVPSALPW
jgi:hypothetical protein